jgi:hypothetical protein
VVAASRELTVAAAATPLSRPPPPKKARARGQLACAPPAPSRSPAEAGTTSPPSPADGCRASTQRVASPLASGNIEICFLFLGTAPKIRIPRGGRSVLCRLTSGPLIEKAAGVGGGSFRFRIGACRAIRSGSNEDEMKSRWKTKTRVLSFAIMLLCVQIQISKKKVI